MNTIFKPKEGFNQTASALSATSIVAKLAQLDGWTLSGDGANVTIEKSFAFASYLETMAFVNAVAFMAQRHQHHPELRVQMLCCVVRWHTHDVGGLTLADFEAAGRVDALLI